MIKNFNKDTIWPCTCVTWPPRLPLILASWVLPQQLSSFLRETFLLNPHVWETLLIVTPEWFSLYWSGVILLAVLSNSRILFSLEKIKHTPHAHTFYAWWGQSATLRRMCAGKRRCKYLGGRSAAWFYALKYWLGPNCLQMVVFVYVQLPTSSPTGYWRLGALPHLCVQYIFVKLLCDGHCLVQGTQSYTGLT